MHPRTLFAALLLAGAFAWQLSGAEPERPKQGADFIKTDLMGIFAHPDDETGVASVLARYALAEGKVVANIYCTRGEGGGNMVGTQLGASLGILREAELRACLGQLGVRHCYFLDQLDWAYTESLAATLQKWGKEETLRRLVRLVRSLRPEVIVTMNPAPNPGQHGHHQAAAVLATEAFDAAADPTRFPEQLTKEGLALWQPRKLYYSGVNPGTVATITTDVSLPGGKTPGSVAAEALTQHRSQAFGNFGNSPWFRRPQTLTLVKSVVPFVESETDLFRGLPVRGAAPRRVAFEPPVETQAALSMSFVPRPAIGAFQRWVKDQGITQVAGRFLADVPVVAGEPNPVLLQLHNSRGAPQAGEVEIAVPVGWQVQPSKAVFRLPSRGDQTLAARVIPPAGAASDVELVATIKAGPEVIQATARLHPVPLLKVPRVATLPLEPNNAAWSHLPSTSISHTNLAQGKTSGTEDSSASFRLAHDGKMLYVETDVLDDHIVSNIAPNDIKGHWRSDSVEICVDPAAGAEHTMGCYKIGVFPFDQAGKVRAARDADANQGPKEETAPGTRLASWKTTHGYTIRVAIPFSEIGIKLGKTKRLGFTIIIYDGDKADAAPGENINKSRIAWAPRAGVQGRPEDWGRIDLE